MVFARSCRTHLRVGAGLTKVFYFARSEADAAPGRLLQTLKGFRASGECSRSKHSPLRGEHVTPTLDLLISVCLNGGRA